MKFPRCLPTLFFAMLCTCCVSVAAWSAAAEGPSQPDEADAETSGAPTVLIPGPLRPFLRMAGISQKISQEEVLPLLAHNVFAQGYEGSRDGGRPTEFLILLSRYVHQARELSALAGAEGSIHVSNCDEAQPLLRILGYRVRQDCGQKNTSLVTSDPERAFLTTDSGFPLPALEETLEGGKSFAYAFPSSRVPVLFTQKDWTSLSNESRKGTGDLVETLLRDPVLCRLYWALSRTMPKPELPCNDQWALGRCCRLAPCSIFTAVTSPFGPDACWFPVGQARTPPGRI